VLRAGNVHPGPNGYTIAQLQRALAARNWIVAEADLDDDAGCEVRISKRRRGVGDVATFERRHRDACLAWMLVLAAAIADDRQWSER
jgi:hypothetical protein